VYYPKLCTGDNNREKFIDLLKTASEKKVQMIA